jgi:hypothetical protein
MIWYRHLASMVAPLLNEIACNVSPLALYFFVMLIAIHGFDFAGEGSFGQYKI